MTQHAAIRFDDGQGYEQYMGQWSRLAGDAFLDWLQPRSGLRWLDVGCGNGAFTAAVFERCAPACVYGIDPSAAQVRFAHKRFATRRAAFQQALAGALPFASGIVDVAVMPLVIFFLPSPAQGVSEMVRALRRGGVGAAYAWDMEGGGFPYHTLQEQMRASGIPVPMPPHPEASRPDVLLRLWMRAGLDDVATHEIRVERRFASFDEYWATVQQGASVGAQLRALPREDAAALEARLRAELSIGADGRITCQARACAVRGHLAP